MRRLTHTGLDESTVRLQRSLTMSAHLARRNRPGHPMALQQLYYRRNRNTELFGG
jgi:hypothetical protein